MPYPSSTNPFLAPELMQNVQPLARNAQSQQQTPQAQQVEVDRADPDFEGRRERWKQYLNNPAVRAGLMQFGVSMLTPGVGFGQAIGHAVEAGGRQQTLQTERDNIAQEEARREREIANEERRTQVYEQSVRQQASGVTGDMSERERFGLEGQRRERENFEKTIRDRAAAEHKAASEAYDEAYNNALVFGNDPTALGPRPTYDSFYNRVSTEEVLRRRGALEMVARMPPVDQEQFWRYAERMGPAAAIQMLAKFWETQQTPNEPPAETPGAQTPGAQTSG